MTATTITDERRVFAGGLELTDLETTESLSMLAGRAVPYNVRTQIGTPFGPYLESFQRGAFAKSTAESARQLPLLLFHNHMTFPIGVVEEWRDESDGLHGVWRIDTAEEAQEAARLAKDGILNFMSVRFQPVPGKTRGAVDDVTGLDHLVRQEARLIETSLVSTPAYSDATVQWVRSAHHPKARTRPNRDYWQRELDKLRA